MKRVYYLIATAGFFALAVVACKKDDPKPVETFNPKATKAVVPEYILSYLGPMPIPADNPLTEEGVALGRKLFYENKLSNTITQNCGTCHKQENSFTDPNQFSKGTDGGLGSRNSMAVVNMGWSNTFFWDGRRNTLEGQAHDPVTNPKEMANTWPVVVKRLQDDPKYPDLFFKAFGTRTIDSNLVTKAIAQFERTMVSFNSRYENSYFKPGAVSSFTGQEEHGLTIFFEHGHCADCHTSLLLTDNSFRNNGLDATFTDQGLAEFTHLSTDAGKFKVPTLRNIALTAPYMHDGRFKTLEEVVEFYSSGVHQGSPNLDTHMHALSREANFTMAEKAALVAFLKTLTDSSFIRNPAFKDPN